MIFVQKVLPQGKLTILGPKMKEIIRQVNILSLVETCFLILYHLRNKNGEAVMKPAGYLSYLCQEPDRFTQCH